MNLMERRRYLLNQTKSRIPSAYQEVEYVNIIQGTSYNAAFSLDIAWKDIRFIDLKMQFLNEPSFGSMLFRSSSGNRYIGFSRNNNYHVAYSGIPSSFTPLVVRSYFLNNGLKEARITIEPNSYTENVVSGYWDSDWSVNWQISKLEIQNPSGVVVKNFVPCYRKSDNIVGFYETINGTFHTNIGNGEFVAGGRV